MANNFELTVVDALIAKLEALTDDIRGKTTKAFTKGVQTVPVHSIKKWVKSLDARAQIASAAVLIGNPELIEDDEGAPADRVQFERINVGVVLVMRGPEDRTSDWRKASGDFVDLWNRMLIDVETAAAILHGAGTVADGPDGSYILWMGDVERPDDLADDYLWRGRMVSFGEHYGAGRTR